MSENKTFNHDPAVLAVIASFFAAHRAQGMEREQAFQQALSEATWFTERLTQKKAPRQDVINSQ